MEGSDPLRIVANLTHELKTPLHAIISTASLLRSGVDGELNSEQRKQVDIIFRNSENLLEMITSLLSFSSTLTESRALTISSIHPVVAIKNLFQEIEPLAIKKGIGFNFQNSSIAVNLFTDIDLLNRLVSNILSNAIKFTPAGGRVELALMDSKDGLFRIQVADTGKGMSQESKLQVFNAFYQADSSSTREHGGVGLGLSLVRHAAELIKANVSVESELGQGSIFTIDIPSLKDQYTPKALSLVGVEDELKDSLKQVLIREGFEVTYISRDKEYQCESSDVIIIDSVVFKDNNFDLVHELKGKREPNPPAIIVMIDAKNSKYRAQLIEAGVDDVISKPINPGELVTKINSLLVC